MENIGHVTLPNVPKGDEEIAILTPNIDYFDEVDYDSRSQIVSDRLKQLIELYMPEYYFMPVAFITDDRQNHCVFWRFKPPPAKDYNALYRSDGVISHIAFSSDHRPIIFTAKSPKGIESIAVRMAVTESTLCRGILGVKFTEILNIVE